MLPKVAFVGFASRYREPRLDEGFQDITRIDFQVRQLQLLCAMDPPQRLADFRIRSAKFEGTPEELAVWSKYWI